MHSKLAVVGFHFSDRLRPVEVEIQATIRTRRNHRGRQKRLEDFFDCNRPGPWPATPMGRGECLVQIHMQDVDAEIAWTGDPHHRIQIRPVHVDQRAAAMQDAGHFRDLALKNAERIRVGDHDAGDIVIHDFP